MMKKQKNKWPETLLNLLGLGLALVSLLGFFGRMYWVFDLCAHFRVQYMQLGLLLIGISLWRRQNKRAVAGVLLACLNYAFVLPLYFGTPTPPTAKPTRAMLMNLNAENENLAHVLRAIRAVDSDLLLLEEVTPKWARELATLNTLYPYQISEPQAGPFGIMFLSKFPLAHSEVVDLGGTGVPSLITEVYLPHGTLSVIGTHPFPPMSAESSRHRNNQLAALPARVQAQRFPVLLLGDLNTSPWSPHFTTLLKNAGLKNSMKGFGFQPSWPRKPRLLRIPIDHILHAPEIIIHHRAVGGDVGSDHFPVWVDFSLN